MTTQEEVIRELRLLYDENIFKENPRKCADLLYQLSRYYQHGADKWSLVCQCALLNGAFLGSDDSSLRKCIISDIEALGQDLLTRRQKTKDFNLFEFSNKMKQTIKIKRDEMAERLRTVNIIPCSLTDKSEVYSLEREIINVVRYLMEDISTYYADLMQKISNKCVEVLGELPCQFSHFAMGSLARQEVTLYSDFENAIILGEGVDWTDANAREEAIEYFRWYAILFDLILINFGETPISLIGITGLNDHYSRDRSKNWFYDTFITCGIMFDSCLPYASKNPFGRKPTFDKPKGTELILPCDKMLQYLTETNSLKEGYHLSNMLLESKHVAGNENLFQEFQTKCIEMANKLRCSVSYTKQDLSYTRENLSKFNLTPMLNTTGWAQHAKKSFYRPMSVHIPLISRLCGVFGFPSTSHIVEKLNGETGLSDEVSHNLLYAIALGNLVRIKVYSERTKQSDRLAGSVNLIDNTTNIMSIFDALGERSALDYYEISIGLRNAIIEIVESIETNINLLQNNSSCFAKQTVVKCFEKHLRVRGDMKLQGDIHRHFQNYDKAYDSYKLALNNVKDANNESLHDRECNILMSLGLTSLHSLRFEESLHWCGKLLELEKNLQRGTVSLTNIATALTMSGQCYTEIPSIRGRLFQPSVQEAENIWKQLRRLEPDNKEHVKGLAELRDTEGFYFLRIGDFNQSITKYEEAHTLLEEYFETGLANNDTIKVKNGIATCLIYLERYEEASAMLDEVIDFKRAMIGDDVADVNISWYLRNKAKCLTYLGQYEEAVSSYKDSMKMRFRAPGSSYDICSSVGGTCRLLAECHLKYGHYEAAIKTAKEVLALVQRIPGTSKEKQLMDMAHDIINRSREKLNEAL